MLLILIPPSQSKDICKENGRIVVPWSQYRRRINARKCRYYMPRKMPRTHGDMFVERANVPAKENQENFERFVHGEAVSTLNRSSL